MFPSTKILIQNVLPKIWNWKCRKRQKCKNSVKSSSIIVLFILFKVAVFLHPLNEQYKHQAFWFVGVKKLKAPATILN